MLGEFYHFYFFGQHIYLISILFCATDVYISREHGAVPRGVSPVLNARRLHSGMAVEGSDLAWHKLRAFLVKKCNNPNLLVKRMLPPPSLSHESHSDLMLVPSNDVQVYSIITLLLLFIIPLLTLIVTYSSAMERLRSKYRDVCRQQYVYFNFKVAHTLV